MNIGLNEEILQLKAVVLNQEQTIRVHQDIGDQLAVQLNLNSSLLQQKAKI
jgi:hypothetical protein